LTGRLKSGHKTSYEQTEGAASAAFEVCGRHPIAQGSVNGVPGIADGAVKVPLRGRTRGGSLAAACATAGNTGGGQGPDGKRLQRTALKTVRIHAVLGGRCRKARDFTRLLRGDATKHVNSVGSRVMLLHPIFHPFHSI